MKILYYSPHPHININAISGYGTHIREMITAFKKGDNIVETLIMGGEEAIGDNINLSFNSSIRKKIVKTIVPPIAWETMKDYNLRRYDDNAYKALMQKIDTFKPDVIYERGYYMMTSGVVAAKGTDVKHIMEINAPYPQERVEMSGKSLMKNLAERKEAKQIMLTDKMVVVSSALKNYFVEKYPTLADKVIVTPNAINIDSIKVNKEKINEIKQKYNLENNIVIGFVGSIFPYHGVDNLITAFNKIKGTNNIKLLIVGDGETLPALKIMVNELNLNDAVIFTGNVKYSEVYNHISAMDITVLAKTNWYCSPVKIFEYGALGKAIIAPNTLAVQDVMTNNVDGILINDNNNELENAMNRLINDVSLRNNLGNSFKDKVLHEHTWEKMAEQILM